MNLIIFGPPGAGKGTQSNFIAKEYNLFQLSTGEILREQIKKKTDLGAKISPIINSGSFVSDEIVCELIDVFIKDEKYKNRIIFDGYPRSLNQVKNLENLLIKYKQKIDLVVKLSVNLETIKKRILERKTLENRDDDNEEIAIKFDWVPFPAPGGPNIIRFIKLIIFQILSFWLKTHIENSLILFELV